MLLLRYQYVPESSMFEPPTIFWKPCSWCQVGIETAEGEGEEDPLVCFVFLRSAIFSCGNYKQLLAIDHNLNFSPCTDRVVIWFAAVCFYIFFWYPSRPSAWKTKPRKAMETNSKPVSLIETARWWNVGITPNRTADCKGRGEQKGANVLMCTLQNQFGCSRSMKGKFDLWFHVETCLCSTHANLCVTSGKLNMREHCQTLCKNKGRTSLMISTKS